MGIKNRFMIAWNPCVELMRQAMQNPRAVSAKEITVIRKKHSSNRQQRRVERLFAPSSKRRVVRLARLGNSAQKVNIRAVVLALVVLVGLHHHSHEVEGHHETRAAGRRKAGSTL